MSQTTHNRRDVRVSSKVLVRPSYRLIGVSESSIPCGCESITSVIKAVESINFSSKSKSKREGEKVLKAERIIQFCDPSTKQ